MDAYLNVGCPKRFGLFEIWLENTIGGLLWTLVAVLFPVALIICVESSSNASYAPLAAGLFLVCGSAVTIIVFMPIFMMNPYVRKIIRLTCGRPKSDEIVFDGQIAFSPRLCDGLRGYMEDADDIGRVMITSEGIDFTGDSVQFSLPFEAIESTTRVSRGRRGFGLLGRRTCIVTGVFVGVDCIEVGERQANTIWDSRRISNEIAYAIDCGIRVARDEMANNSPRSCVR